MHTHRLEVLRDLLREDAANPQGSQFDLGLWIGQSDQMNTYGAAAAVSYPAEVLGVDTANALATRVVAPEKLPTISCGTTACALGLAVLSGRFAQWGLKAEYSIQGSGLVRMLPSCNGEDSFGAGAELFDISVEDSQYLFDPECYPCCPKKAEGELIVAERIDAFINGDIAKEYHDSDDEDEDEDEDDSED